MSVSISGCKPEAKQVSQQKIIWLPGIEPSSIKHTLSDGCWDQNVLYYAISYMTPALYQFQHALSIKPGKIYIQADVYYTM